MKANELPDIDSLHKLLSYNASSGDFFWKIDRANKTRPMTKAGNVHPYGYRAIRIFGTRYPAHRLAWKMFYGVDPVGQIDHIDGDRQNNRIINLRLASQSENSQNQKKARADNKSGMLGVSSRVDGKFSATIGLNKKRIHLGVYSKPEDAHLAYLEAKKKLHPFSTLKENK